MNLTSRLPRLSSLAPVAAAVLLGLSSASALAQATPKIVKKVPPEFPAEAVRKGVDRGVLKAKVTIDEKGVPTDVAIVDTQPPKARILNDTVSESLKSWRFEGQGKSTSFELQVVFAAE
jgi:periplasmic protein TonB